jgi:hypothetical protein
MTAPIRSRRITRPPLTDRANAWSTTFNQVLGEMLRASKQPEIARPDMVSTAAIVAATLVVGAEL